MPSALSPLALVQFGVVRAVPSLRALPHVGDMISSLLDVSTSIPLARAAASGSVHLVERVAGRLLDDPVDSIARDDAFASALESAIKADDLEIVKTIHNLHPEPLVVPSLQLAVQFGSLELVQWVIEHRHDCLCSPVRADRFCQRCVADVTKTIGPKDPFRVALWLVEQGFVSIKASPTQLSSFALSALAQSAELVRQWDAQQLLAPSMIDEVLDASLARPTAATVEVVRYLSTLQHMPRQPHKYIDRLLQLACQRDQEALVELLLETFMAPLQYYFTYGPARDGGGKVLRRSREYERIQSQADWSWRRRVIQTACELGHLDTMKWLAEAQAAPNLFAPGRNVTEDEQLAILAWLETTKCRQPTEETMKMAAVKGHVRVLQWFHAHRQVACTMDIMDLAVANGHVHILQWLEDIGFQGRASRDIHVAATSGHLDVVQWLYERYEADINVSTVMAFAAANGHLALVDWCLDHRGCAHCVQQALLTPGGVLLSQVFIRGDGGLTILYPLQRIDQQCQQTTGAPCAGACVDYRTRFPQNLSLLALQWGNLDLLEYLHEHHSKCFEWPLDTREEVLKDLRGNGHAPVVEWMYKQYPDLRVSDTGA